MNIIGIIPARMASTRFPGKPLAKINGTPMIGHVYNRSKMAKILDEVYVATCDQEIFDYIESINGKAVMTADTHERASDRSAEALEVIENQKDKTIDIVVMLQGDEPMLVPEMINAAVQPFLEDSNVDVVNLMAKINSEKEWNDPNEVKVVIDNNSNAMYFSREPIPSNQKYNGAITAYKQVCIIPFSREGLKNYLSLDETPLEKVESVDMNRILEHGGTVKMVLTKYETYAVDTIEDLKKVESLMLNYIQK
ncbi:MAG: 3-deoxy-manno-octulosonate cytidylyltransferase [Candidatus Marinimicrobia bacterium]|nr:3-deoxy-manno-octulosonate cytidylyltransferase [Candidatus Neomarinimicrobiota bacterium]|tara:strand:+ start:6412 stop:7167 length:756 start_codon:yes stop_codon:yes gene_type:complete